VGSTILRFKWAALVILICLPAAWPYLGGDIPRSNDSLTHLYRAVELDRLVRAGDLFPRWGPDFAHGYGYPVFNYFAYFSHYLIVLFHLGGLSLLGGVRAAYVAATLGSGLSAYLLGKTLAADEGKQVAGLTSAVAYVYSPYLLYTANVRGGLPENLALAFLPLAFWGLRESLKQSRQLWKPIRSDGIAMLAITGFIASHVGMAIQYVPLLGLWGAYCILRAVWLSGANWRGLIKWWPSVVALGVILALGLGVTAFLWLPSVSELPYVQFESAFAQAGLVYSANFLHVGDLFAYPSLPIYTEILNPPVIRTLAIPVVVLAVAGLGLIKKFGCGQRADYLILFAALIATVFLTLDVSKPIWDAIGLLQRSTFPWRFLGPASLIAALMVGMALGAWWKQGNKVKQGTVWVAIVVMGVAALPFMFPPREAALETPTIADLARYEIPPLLVGTTTTGEYTPLAVKTFPDTHTMQSALEARQAPERLDAPGATIEQMSAQPGDDVYKINTPSAIQATYRSFYFPGWEVWLDGKPTTIAPTDPNGLIGFEVPAGEHTLEVKFGTTPIRIGAGWISILSALIMLGVFVVGYRSAVVEEKAIEPLGWKGGFGLVAVLYAALLIGAFLLLKQGPPQTQHPLALDYAGELTLVGYDESKLSGSDSKVTLVWQAQHAIGIPYGFNVRLTDDQGLVYSDTNIDRPSEWRFYPGTDFWQPNQYILDSYILKPLAGTPPGKYHLEVIAYRTDNLQALSTQVIGAYVIEKPTNEALAAPLLSLQGVNLIRMEGDRAAAAPGESYRLSLRWQAATDAPADQTVKLELVDAAGKVAYSRMETVSAAYPPTQWKTGDVVNQEVFFRLPASVAGGSFHWRVGGNEMANQVALTINEPQRIFVLLASEHVLGASFGPLNLVGWDQTLSDKTLTVVLDWQAKQEMDVAYRVFLHALDSEGNLVAQSDGEPVNWTRPTTGWLAGEVVLDSRTLTLPASGDYLLEAGLVDEVGNRLGEAVSLGKISVP